MKQKFDKKEKSIFALDKLFKDIGKNAKIANQQAIKEKTGKLFKSKKICN